MSASASGEKFGLLRRFMRLASATFGDAAMHGAAPERQDGARTIEAATAAGDLQPEAPEFADTQTEAGPGPAEAAVPSNRFMLSARLASVNALNRPVSKIKPAAKKIVRRHVRLARPADAGGAAGVPVELRPNARASDNVVQLYSRAA